MLVLFDVVGWVGGGAVAVAYVLVSARRIAPDSTMFQMLNVVGADTLAAPHQAHLSHQTSGG